MALKFVAFIVVVLAVGAGILWQSRFDVVLWALPKLLKLTTKIGPNQPVQWSAGPATPTPRPSNQRPPNIILILADDLGFNDVSMYGHGGIPTPHIDSIGLDGVRFNQAYAGNAICSPSRATIMTGRYSTRFGFEFTPFPPIGATFAKWTNDLNPSDPLQTEIYWPSLAQLPKEPIKNLGMPTSEVTVAEVLRDVNYHTVHIGKWHLGGSNGMEPLSQGFNESLDLVGTMFLPPDDPNVVNGYTGMVVDRMMWSTGQYAVAFNQGPKFEPKGYLTDYFTDQAVEVIENNKNRPFFMYLAHWGLHNPLQCTKEDYDALAHIKDHNHRVYAGMTRALDRGVGKILATLKANGLDDNTLVLFTSDNGGADYIGLSDINKPYRGWKLTHFEGGTHIPFAMKWPNQIKSGQVTDKVIHHSDIIKTFATAGGAKHLVPTDRVVDGIDLLDVVNNDAPGHKTLFWQQGAQASVRHGNWKLIEAARGSSTVWLFNLDSDPTEKTNLADTRPDMVRELKEMIRVHRSEQPTPGWPGVLSLPVLVDYPATHIYEEGNEYLYWPN